ncbi:MAG: hypothetical protein J7M26_10375, partial [Armatimonadetes bacterium]|nr:hypothetical protein [Armatimonadota bacterium]
MRRLLPPFFLALPSVLLVLHPVRADLHVVSPRPGRVFFDRENVSLGLFLDKGRVTVRYEVFDYWGRKLAQGKRVVVSPRTAQLKLRRFPCGWYELRLYLPDGSVKKDAFAVLPPMEDQGRHYRLFGLCATLDDQARADYLSFGGFRAIRRDWGWPTIEPWPDRWAPGFTEGIMTRAQKAGLQFLPIVGYAPRYAGVKPADAFSGRPSYAGHTWPIGNKQEWVEFLQWCRDFAGQFPDVQWPPPRLAPKASTRQVRPAVSAWEIWNEADQNFFYGPWHNYCDLLRLSYGVLDTLSTPIIYGGSCGHWTETGMSYSWGLQNFFDVAAGHGGHEVDESMPRWLYGAYCIGYKFAKPYRLAFTEGYFQDDETHRPLTKYMLAMYAKLMHYRVKEQYRGLGWSSSREIDRGTSSLCHWFSDGLAASPPYVAMAFARYLLVDAAYAGRVKVQKRVEAFVFLRAGIPHCILWNAGKPCFVTLPVGSTAVPCTYNLFGKKRTYPRATSLRVHLNDEPLVVRGVAWSLVAEAAQARLDEFFDYQLGMKPRVGDYWCPYVGCLGQDLARLAPAQSEAARAAAQQAFDLLGRRGRGAYNALQEAVDAFGDLLIALAPKEDDVRSPTALYDTAWRTMEVAEWLAELSDAVGERLRGKQVPDSQVQALQADLSRVWQETVLPQEGLVRSQARALARRGWSTCELAKVTRGRGMAGVARREVAFADAWGERERPTLVGVLAVTQWPTTSFLVKAHMMPPGQTHTAQPLLYNMTPHEVTATIHFAFPAGWDPETAAVTVTAAPYSIVQAPEVHITVPGDQPWVQKASWRPSTPLRLYAPQQLPPEQQVEVWAEYNGYRSSSAYYYFNVGSLNLPEP